MRLLVAIMLINIFNQAWSSGTVREAQRLSLGEIAVVRNDAIYTAALDPNLGMINDPAIVILSEGKPGIFIFENFPSNTLINVSLNEATLNTNYAGTSGVEQFELRPTLPTESFNTDINGIYELKLYGILKTSGTGKNYVNGIYFKDFSLTVNY